MTKVDFSLEYRDLSIHATNPFVEHNSSPRSSMYASHINQALVLKESELPFILTGAEKRLGDLAMDITMPEDAIIESIIYRRSPIDNLELERYIVYYGLESERIDVIQVPNYITNHQYFGYPLYIEGIFPTIGDKVYKGQVLAHTPNKHNKGTNDSWYGYGRNLNTAFMELPSVAEDGFIVSRSALSKLAFVVYEKRTIDVHRESDGMEGYPSINVPLNCYGTNDEYKIMPDIGEYIRTDAVVAATRKIRLSRYGAQASNDALRRLEFKTDSIIYSRNGYGKVIDINVIKGLSLSTSKIAPYRQLEMYAANNKKFYMTVLEIEDNINYKYRNSNVVGTIYGPRMLSLIEEARVRTGIPINRRSRGMKEKSLRFTHQKDPIGDYRAELTIEHLLLPNIGSKLSDRAGGKGVIVEIREDHEMPIDEYGTRAEVIVDKNSIISRMNPGRFYEQSYNHAVLHVTKQTREILSESGMSSVSNIPVDIKQRAKEHILGFLDIVSPKQKEVVEQASMEELDDMFQQIMYDSFYLYKDIKDHGEPVEIMDTLISSIYYPEPTKVSWTGSNGEIVTTVKPVLIAPTYIMLLEKIGDSGMAVSSPRSNHVGIFVKLPKHSKNKYPVRLNPVRIVGESETRILATYGGQECIAELLDQGTNPDTHRHIYRELLSTDTPTNLDRAIDRTTHPLGKTIPISIIEHVYFCQGLEDRYEKTGD